VTDEGVTEFAGSAICQTLPLIAPIAFAIDRLAATDAFGHRRGEILFPWAPWSSSAIGMPWIVRSNSFEVGVLRHAPKLIDYPAVRRVSEFPGAVR